MREGAEGGEEKRKEEKRRGENAIGENKIEDRKSNRGKNDREDQKYSWRAHGDVSLILSNSSPDNPSTDDVKAIIDYVCGYACKDSEPTGATADLFKDMVNAVDAADAEHVNMCAKMLIKTVGRQDISGPEASFELNWTSTWVMQPICLHTCQCQGQGDLNGMVALQLIAPLKTSILHDHRTSIAFGTILHSRMVWFHFASKNVKAPAVSRGTTHATWPLNEDYCCTGQTGLTSKK